MSGDGRYVVFDSWASNLVRRDSNGERDVFVRDRARETTVLVSIASDGTRGNRRSFDGTISADGRLIAFTSAASNLVRRDTNRSTDVFVRNRLNNRTTRASVSTQGEEGIDDSHEPDLSRHGRYLAFTSYGFEPLPPYERMARGVYLRGRATGTTRAVAPGDYYSDYYSPDLSANGRYLVYTESFYATDNWVHYRDLTKRRSETIAGGGNLRMGVPSISADGRYVAFWRNHKGFLYDHETDTTALVTLTALGEPARPALPPVISGNGRWVVFGSGSTQVVPEDTNDVQDVFIRHR